MALTYKEALAFRDSEVGSQIPRVERLLRSSNWSNLNGGLKKQYLKEIEGAIADPVKYSYDQLKKDAAGYLVYQGLPGGGGTAKAEAKELKRNIDKYTNFLQNNSQSPETIAATVDQGFVQGQKQLKDSVKRMNDEPFLNKVSDVALQVGLGAATAGLSLPGQVAANAALQLGQGSKPMDILKNVARTGGSYFGKGLLSNAMGSKSLVAGNTPSFAPPQTFVPGTSVPVNTALNLGKTAYNVATAKDPALALTKAAFNYGKNSNLGPSLGLINTSQTLPKF